MSLASKENYRPQNTIPFFENDFPSSSVESELGAVYQCPEDVAQGRDFLFV